MVGAQSPAQHFFDTHLVPNYEAWQKQPTDLRLAMNAAVSLYHMADHFWNTFHDDKGRVFDTDKSGKFRQELAKRHKDFALLRDVTEAHKHMKLTDPNPRKVTESKQTAVGSTGWGEAGYGTGPVGGVPSIVVDLNDGTKQHLSYTAKVVKELWESMLA